jgi:hypothetical protein
MTNRTRRPFKKGTEIEPERSRSLGKGGSKPSPSSGRGRGGHRQGSSKPYVSRAGSRQRSDDTPASLSLLGQTHMYKTTGEDLAPGTVEHHINYPRIKRCWDESHALKRPLKAKFIQQTKIGFKQKVIYGKPIHTSGGPLRLYSVNTFPQPEVLGRGVYEGRDFRFLGPSGFVNVYEGGFVPNGWPHGFSITDFNFAGLSGPLDPDTGSPSSLGAGAYNRFKPKLSKFDGMQFVFDDIKDLPQQLKTTSKLFSDSYQTIVGKKRARELVMPKNVADQFLNYQFGWSPFLNDLSKLHKTYQNQDKHLGDLRRQNGVWIKKGGNILSDVNIEEIPSDPMVGSVYPALTTDYYSDPAGPYVTSKLHKATSREAWFDGAFTFYAPELDSTNNNSGSGQYSKVIQLLHLYGIRVSPTVIWELTPWTWLVDWFSNAGDVIDNVTSTIFDRLVSQYAYVMQRTRITAFNDSIIHLKKGDVPLSWRQEIDIKYRVAASKYGFGLTDDDLSTRQKMILAALGLTHGT